MTVIAARPARIELPRFEDLPPVGDESQFDDVIDDSKGVFRALRPIVGAMDGAGIGLVFGGHAGAYVGGGVGAVIGAAVGASFGGVSGFIRGFF